MISIKNIPLNTTAAFFYIEDKNKVTFSEQVTLIEYSVYSVYSVYSEYGDVDDSTELNESIESNETVKERFKRFLKSFNLKLKIIKR